MSPTEYDIGDKVGVKDRDWERYEFWVNTGVSMPTQNANAWISAGIWGCNNPAYNSKYWINIAVFQDGTYEDYRLEVSEDPHMLTNLLRNDYNGWATQSVIQAINIMLWGRK